MQFQYANLLICYIQKSSTKYNSYKELYNHSLYGNKQRTVETSMHV
jgi:hypothetical protein